MSKITVKGNVFDDQPTSQAARLARLEKKVDILTNMLDNVLLKLESTMVIINDIEQRTYMEVIPAKPRSKK